jgi:hypothetical protein
MPQLRTDPTVTTTSEQGLSVPEVKNAAIYVKEKGKSSAGTDPRP